MRPTSVRDGAFSNRLMVDCEQGSRPLSGARPTASLNSGPARSSSLLSLSKGVGVLISTGEREHAEPKHRRQRVNRPFRIPPLPDATGQRVGQAEPPLRRAQQHQTAVRRDRPAGEIGGHLLALYGWKIEREKSIFGHGGRGALVASAEMRWTTNFYPMSTG